MGRMSRLRRLGREGTPDSAKLCPNEHDPDSLQRILSKSWDPRIVAFRKLSQLSPGSMDLTILTAMKKHDEACWPNRKEYCECPWCESNRRRLNANT